MPPSMLDQLQLLAFEAAPMFPPAYWWVTAAVFLLLVLAAWIDFRHHIVPDALVILGLLAITGLQGIYMSWPDAAHHLRDAIIAGFAIWGVNAIWFRAFHHDALGMGDAKWSALAASSFGLMPLLFTWGIGAVLACIFLTGASLAHRKIAHLPFVPFLMVGLCLSVWGIRF
jgi:leader peptidase (prepilin peptidase)/N-methyltransferase